MGRFSAILFAGLLAAQAPNAVAQNFNNPILFHRIFEIDVPGGHYQIGEDNEISSRFRNGTSVAADFRIVTPYRTEKFGSGVAFYLLDKAGERYVRVAFIDRVEESKVALVVERSVPSDTSPRDKVADRQLSILKNGVGRVTIRKETSNRSIIRVDGLAIPVDHDFVVDQVHVQVYCAKGWAKFLDGELLS